MKNTSVKTYPCVLVEKFNRSNDLLIVHQSGAGILFLRLDVGGRDVEASSIDM
jgi:hypothetical protein